MVIDSGSTDGSLEFTERIAETNPNLLCHKLNPAEFGHGKTRNMGASLTSGQYIAFITHDALPYNNQWLEKLIEPLEKYPDVAGGVFGRHLPYDDADIFEKDNLKRHFENFGTELTVFSIEDRQRYDADEGYRHFLCFYSDNASCMRRSVWEKKFRTKTLILPKIKFGLKRSLKPVIRKHMHLILLCITLTDTQTKSFSCVSMMTTKIFIKYIIINLLKIFFLLPAHIFRHVLADYRFLKTITIPRDEKKFWLKYSFIKNFMRYTGGYFGVKGANSEFMDRLFSRDFRIRGGK